MPPIKTGAATAIRAFLESVDLATLSPFFPRSSLQRGKVARLMWQGVIWNLFGNQELPDLTN
jgi:hypothetical protein